MSKTYKVRYRKTLPKRMQYAGSTIQQNFGETLDKGYLLWDIKDRDNYDSEFVKLENDYGFYTIQADGGELPDIELPPKCRVRVIWPIAERDISRSLVNELTQMVHDKYKPLSVRIDFKPGKSRGTDLDIDTVLDVRELNVQQDLLRKWLVAHELPEDMQAEIVDIDKVIFDKASDLDMEDFHQSVWKINSIEIKDFMSYKGPEIIDFRKLRGVVGLFGDNRSGKSVMIDAILYALFNKTTRDVKNHELINKVTKAKKCSVRLNITIRGVEYQITRVTKMQFKKRTGEYTWTRTDLELKRVHEDGTVEDLTETQRNETEKIIRNAIGSYDDFLTTTLTTQSSQHEFIFQNPSVRAANMARFLGLEIFNKKHDLAKEVLREVDSARKVQDLDAKTRLLTKTREKAEQAKKMVSEKRKLSRDLGTQLRKRNDLLETLRSSINSAITIDKTREELEDQMADVSNDLDQLAEMKHQETASQLDYLARAKKAEAMLKDETEEMVKLADQLPELMDADMRVANRMTTLRALKKSLNEELSSNPSCPVGENDVTAGCVFLKQAQTKRQHLAEYTEELDELAEKGAKLSRKIERAQKAAQRLADNSQVRSAVQKLTHQAEECRTQAVAIDSKIELKEMALAMLEDKVEIIAKNEEIVKSNRALTEQIDETKSQIRKLQDQRDRVNDEVTEASSDLAVATARIEELEALVAEIATNDRKYELYNWYVKAMHRNGIPITVLRKYVPVINYELNKILSPIVGFGVYFKIEDGNDNIEIVMRYDDKVDDTRSITMASGMEKFIANMAIRHVLLKISTLNKPTLRIIDEGFDVLDNDNVYLVQKFFDNVKGEFDNIVLITHIDALKDCADHVVTVSQVNGVSKLRLN